MDIAAVEAKCPEARIVTGRVMNRDELTGPKIKLAFCIIWQKE